MPEFLKISIRIIVKREKVEGERVEREKVKRGKDQ